MGGSVFRRQTAALTVVLVGALGVAIAAQGGLQRQRLAWPVVEEAVLVPSPAAARIMSLGYRELVADLFWTRTLVYYGEGLSENLSLAWVDSLVATVNALDPLFRRPYRWGAFATTYKRGAATQEEFKASVRVLERGVKAFPEDHELLWLLGLRYTFDLAAADDAEKTRNAERGATYMERAMRAPGAPATYALSAAALRTRLGQTERALKELEEMILNTSDPRARAQLEARYRDLADAGAADAIAEEAKRFDAKWQADLPFAPPSLYVLMGDRPPRAMRRLDELAAPPTLEPTPELP